jgi:hypothetical protein
METNVEYKGYRLHPIAKRTTSGQWSAEVVIEHAAQDDAEDFDFRSDELFATAKEAERAAIALGTRIVDGEHPHFSLG